MDGNLQKYLHRLNFDGPLEATHECLERLHHAHFYTVPFENFSMHDPGRHQLDRATLQEEITANRRGGICYETGALMAGVLDHCGFDHQTILASVLGPHPSPATHMVFIVRLGTTRWLFDIGYGALGPRGVVRLEDGAELKHPALDTRVGLEPGPGPDRWTVSVLEHASGATDWRPVYRFIDAPVGPKDLEMSHFYTVFSPNSALNNHKVASLPTPAGRVNVRDGALIVVNDGHTSTTELTDPRDLADTVRKYFGMDVPLADLTKD